MPVAEETGAAMNLKYYLRGLGLGIVITAILLAVTAGSRKESLTDEEIIARAKTLGMLEETVLNDSVAKAKDETETQLRNQIEDEVKNELEAQLRSEIEAEFAAAAAAEQAAAAAEPIVFTVERGETPYGIGERLAEQGLVTTAEEFDRFLTNNGYDRSIVAAQYRIPVGADMETIARIITGEGLQ